MDERRKFPRLKSSFTVEVRPSEEREGQTHNISAGGILFMHKKEVTPGAILDLTLRVPGLSGTVDIKGKVVRCDIAQAGSYNVGVQFVDVDEEAVKEILETIQSF